MHACPKAIAGKAAPETQKRSGAPGSWLMIATMKVVPGSAIACSAIALPEVIIILKKVSEYEAHSAAKRPEMNAVLGALA